MHPRMMRKGKSTGGREALDDDYRRTLDDACRAYLRELGSDFPYDDASPDCFADAFVRWMDG